MNKFHSYISFPHRGHPSSSWCLLNWREFPHIYRTNTWFVCFIYLWELAVTYNFSMNNNLVLICEMSPVLEPCMNEWWYLFDKEGEMTVFSNPNHGSMTFNQFYIPNSCNYPTYLNRRFKTVCLYTKFCLRGLFIPFFLLKALIFCCLL